MKKIYFLLLVLLIPIHINADSINIDCPDKIEKNSEFTCKLTGESKSLISGVSAQVNISSDLELLAVVIDKRWLGDGKDGNIKVFTDDYATGNFDIGTLKLKSNGTNNNILINSIAFYDDNVDSIRVDNMSIPIVVSNQKIAKEQNKNVESNKLVDLKVDKYNIDFSKNIEEYNIKIDDEKQLDITPILEDNTSKYEIIGNKNLKNGSKIRINITTSLGDKKTYILNIEKNQKMGFAEIIFITILVVLILINLFRIIKNRKNRGTKNEK